MDSDSFRSSERRRVGLIYDERMGKHFDLTDKKHPESPDRIHEIWNKLQDSGIAERCTVMDGKEAKDEHISLVHNRKHIDFIKSISSKQEKFWKEMTKKYNSVYFNQGSSEAAYISAGCVIEVAEKVAEGELDSAFAIVRPPGHHAEPNQPMGFCLFNNVAIATQYLLDKRADLGIKKILIVDWDVHHGNGTQKMFQKDPRVLFFSVHRHNFGTCYPCDEAGSHKMTGEGPGKGYNINVPWEHGGCGDADYLAVWDHVLIPVAKEFCPDIVLISAGFDAAIGDPLGGCCVSPHGYAVMLNKLLEFAGGKIVMALEGGYDKVSTSNSVQACIEVLLHQKPIIGSSEAYPFESTWRVIGAVREKLSSFWQSFSERLPEKVTSMSSPYIQVVSSDIENVIQPFSDLKVNDGTGITSQASSNSHTWREVLSKIDIWYATFGSNMKLSRFLCYIAGGQFKVLSMYSAKIKLEHLNDWEVQRVAAFLNKLDQFPGVQAGEDHLWWQGNSQGIFKVSAAYKIMNQSNHQIANWPWKQIWRIKVPHKVLIFVWLLAKDATLTVDNLMSRGMTLCSRCFLCKETAETVNHLLLHCLYPTHLWRIILNLKGSFGVTDKMI